MISLKIAGSSGIKKPIHKPFTNHEVSTQVIMTASHNSNNAVNLEELKEIMSDDMELINECFADFLEDWPVLFVEIENAILENDFKTLDSSAHKLKGTLKYLSAQTASNKVYVIESAGKQGDMAGAAEKLSNLKNDCQRVVDYINNFN
jgi:HPt (histidine-containing phosphotransfer) domain-containing protein